MQRVCDSRADPDRLVRTSYACLLVDGHGGSWLWWREGTPAAQQLRGLSACNAINQPSAPAPPLKHVQLDFHGQHMHMYLLVSEQLALDRRSPL